jgi:SagB-type dehydrogenase family enzyme
LRQVAPVHREALRRIEPPGEDENHLVELVRGDGDGSLARWYYYLERLSRRNLVCHSAHANGTRLATLLPISSSFEAGPRQAVSSHRYVLSRFAYLRRSGGEVVVESPLAPARVILHDARAAALIGALAIPATVEELTGHIRGLSPDAVAGLFRLLLRVGMIDDDSAPEDAALQTWEFHDLLFHTRSRMGRSDAPCGATYRFAGQLEPLPALKPKMTGETIELERPDLAQLQRDDPPLAYVQERRCSIRNFDDDHPITARQLGEFLFRVARVKDCWRAEVATEHGMVPMDFASRPYPGGGSLYELELCVGVNLCADLQPGLYHYDPARHGLTRLCECTPDVDKLLRDAAEAVALTDSKPQVLLILAARFPRVAWKYESIAYALILKHVGVVFQTMYLAATAMGLGACAVGCGDSDRFARAAGTDYYAETSVGEFLLGSRRDVSLGFVP